ncbi:MAG: alpha/beta fold hydrolase [Gemmatimonadetes bacterium]|nr:alpha/beta fold hydrolase [Gemmatimonadota bacterium]
MTLSETTAVLTNDEGRPVHVDVRRPGGGGDPGGPSLPVVVVLHGFKGFKDWGMFPPTARRIAERGFAVVSLNASRNGVGDPDRPEEFTDLEGFAHKTPQREIDDVRLVLRAIASGELGDGMDAARIGLLGHSRGGGVMGLVAAAEPGIRALVLWAAVSTFQRYTPRAVAAWREKGRMDVPNARTGQLMWLDRAVLEDLERNRDAYDLETALARVRAPTLVIHGERDEAVSVTDAENLYAWAAAERKELLLIPKTGHTFGAAHPWNGGSPAWERAVEATAAWFEDTLRGPNG